MNSLTCTLCHLSGHAAPQCWFNGALYEECRRQGCPGLNYAFRGRLKLAHKKEALQLRYEQIEKLAEEAIVSKIDVQTKIANKRARRQ